MILTIYLKSNQICHLSLVEQSHPFRSPVIITVFRCFLFGGFFWFDLIWFLKSRFLPLICFFLRGGFFFIWFLKLLLMFLFPLKLRLLLSCFLLRVFRFLRIEGHSVINIVLIVHMFQAHRSTGNTKLSKADSPSLVLVIQKRIQAMN